LAAEVKTAICALIPEKRRFSQNIGAFQVNYWMLLRLKKTSAGFLLICDLLMRLIS